MAVESNSFLSVSASNAALLNENNDHTARVSVLVEPRGGEGHKRINREAAERIRRLEQINLTLLYQFRSVGSLGNDFVRFGPGDWRAGGDCSEF